MTQKQSISISPGGKMTNQKPSISHVWDDLGWSQPALGSQKALKWSQKWNLKCSLCQLSNSCEWWIVSNWFPTSFQVAWALWSALPQPFANLKAGEFGADAGAKETHLLGWVETHLLVSCGNVWTRALGYPFRCLRLPGRLPGEKGSENSTLELLEPNKNAIFTCWILQINKSNETESNRFLEIETLPTLFHFAKPRRVTRDPRAAAHSINRTTTQGRPQRAVRGAALLGLPSWQSTWRHFGMSVSYPTNSLIQLAYLSNVTSGELWNGYYK